ncbi:diguanylate cyclase [bacterium]|nr:diguanylate cyclase [bacterium]MBU1884762.1 diguanylate cyclase [bacterium]
MRFLKDWMSKQSIQNKLMYSNLFAIFIAFIPVVIVLMTYEFYAMRTAVIEEIRVQADIIAESSAAAVAFRDNAVAEETLSSLHGAKEMIEAHLILSDGTIFQSYYRKQNAKKLYVALSNAPTTSRETITSSVIVIKKPIYLRSELVGSLILISSLDGFYTRMLWYAIIVIIIAIMGLLFARLVSLHISRTITEPLTYLMIATQKIMKSQDYTTSFSIDTEDEVGSLSRAFGEMMTQINNRDMTMQQLAYYDRVTGIANRHFFEERIAQVMSNAQRYGTSCYLLILDLDDFKIVNDKLGHHVGDILLRNVSEILTSTMRQNDNIFRIGGDEFAIIIESASDHEPVGQIAKKIIHAISTPAVLEGHTIKVGVSIGISCFPRFSTNVKTLMSTADAAMYIAKGQGKNSYHVYGQE